MLKGVAVCTREWCKNKRVIRVECLPQRRWVRPLDNRLTQPSSLKYIKKKIVNE
jgi:hypothetical protein